jgi:hypothetical protein
MYITIYVYLSEVKLMKIGVLLIGQVRNFDISVDHIKKEFDMEDIEVDYFCHTWDSVANFSPWNNMITTDERFSDLQFHDHAELVDTINLINPKKYKIDSYNNLEYLYENLYYPEANSTDTDNTVLHHFRNLGWRAYDSESKLTYADWVYFFSLLGQFYSSARALDLLCEYEKEIGEKYDVIVRWRYDLVSQLKHRTNGQRANTWTEEPLQSGAWDTIFFNCLNIWNGMQCSGDHYWYGAAGAFKSFTMNLDTKYIDLVRSRIMSSGNILNENIMQELIINKRMSSRESPKPLAVVRPGATKEMTFDQLYDLELQHEQTKRKLAGNKR